MPYSYHVYDQQIADLFSRAVPATARILDVGAGSGKYGHMLGKGWDVDAVEIHGPNIEQFGLRELYRDVYETDVRDFLLSPAGLIDNYDVVILGDVLEHLSVRDAQDLLRRLDHACVLVAVPFNYEQGAVGGNEHERHQQPDLTPQSFDERYPGFRCLGRLPYYGVYAKPPNGQDLPDSWVFPDPEPHVLIATPCHDWSYSTHYMVSMLATQKYHLQNGIPFSGPISWTGAEVERARNCMVAQFMGDPKYTHICFIDSDQGWPADTVARLVSHSVDMVGVPIRKKTQEVHWNITVKDQSVEIRNGLIEVDGIGTGILLISRKVIERMFEAYPDLQVLEDEELPHSMRGSMYALFQRTLDNGQYVSEDLMFCRRFKRIGGRIFADPTIEACHVGRAEFTGRLADFSAEREISHEVSQVSTP